MTEFSVCMENLPKLTESELEILMDEISQEKSNRKRKALQNLAEDAEEIFSRLIEVEPFGTIEVAINSEYEEVYFSEIWDSLRKFALSLR